MPAFRAKDAFSRMWMFIHNTEFYRPMFTPTPEFQDGRILLSVVK